MNLINAACMVNCLLWRAIISITGYCASTVISSASVQFIIRVWVPFNSFLSLSSSGTAVGFGSFCINSLSVTSCKLTSRY